jgi:hypothetical protein
VGSVSRDLPTDSTDQDFVSDGFRFPFPIPVERSDRIIPWTRPVWALLHDVNQFMSEQP